MSVPGTSCRPSAASRERLPSSQLTWASSSGGAGGGSAICWDERWAAWAQESGRLDVSGEPFCGDSAPPWACSQAWGWGSVSFLMPLTC